MEEKSYGVCVNVCHVLCHIVYRLSCKTVNTLSISGDVIWHQSINQSGNAYIAELLLGWVRWRKTQKQEIENNSQKSQQTTTFQLHRVFLSLSFVGEWQFIRPISGVVAVLSWRHLPGSSETISSAKLQIGNETVKHRFGLQPPNLGFSRRVKPILIDPGSSQRLSPPPLKK